MTSTFKATLVSSLVMAALGASSAALAVPMATTELADGLIVRYKTVNMATAFTKQGEANARAAASTLSARGGERLEFNRRFYNGAQVLRTSRVTNLRDAEALAKKLKATDPNIESVEPNAILHAMSTPNDSRYADMWHLFDEQAGMNAPAAWGVTTGKGAVVAVLDTGVRPHADLAANLLPGYDMINSLQISADGDGRDADASDAGDTCEGNASSWHGTHVAGTVAAVGNNNNGVIGVAYGAKVVPVRVLGKCGGSLADIAEGMIWAAGGEVKGLPLNKNPAKVLNLSLGGFGRCSETYQAAVDKANSLGAIVVVAAGNDDDEASKYRPANCNNVIAVAATGRSGARSYFSNFGPTIDIAAPGGDQSTGQSHGILSTWNEGRTTPGQDSYTYMQGTSMASPNVAGVVALMVAVKPGLTPSEAETILKQTARPLAAGACPEGCGAGMVDAHAAVRAAAGSKIPDDDVTLPIGPKVLKNNVPVTALAAARGADVVYTFQVPAGAKDLRIASSGGTGDADLYVKFGSTPTDSSYDCRPYRSGNAESCAVAAPKAGTYYVRAKSFAAFKGLTLVGSYTVGGSTGGGDTGPAPLSYSNNTSYNIPDWNDYGISSPITVTRGGVAGKITVEVNIAHSFVNDLTVELLAPNGNVSVLQARQGGSAKNLVKTFSVDASKVTDSKGVWNLRVKDGGFRDTGSIKGWKLTFAK